VADSQEGWRVLRIAVYPGSFDPVTNGHINILERSSRLFDHIIVAVVHNLSKCAVFSLPERVALLKACTRHISNVEVEGFSGLLADFLKARGCYVVIRGLRSITDFEYETCMSMMNRALWPKMETLFIMSDREYIHVSSSAVKEVARLGGEVDKLVPPEVKKCLLEKLQSDGEKG
jgi:pantetheine-phosphate adenylyltransferase